MADGQNTTAVSTDCSKLNSEDNTSTLLTTVNCKLCSFCNIILKVDLEGHCKKYYLGIVVPFVTLIVLILFFQYICMKCCKSSKSRKNKKKEADLRMNSFEPRYERPHRRMYHGQVYGESMQQSYMFPGDRMHSNKHRQPFLYEQTEEPRKKKKKKKRPTREGPKMEENNDEENKTRPKKKKKKKKKKMVKLNVKIERMMHIM